MNIYVSIVRPVTPAAGSSAPDMLSSTSCARGVHARLPVTRAALAAALALALAACGSGSTAATPATTPPAASAPALTAPDPAMLAIGAPATGLVFGNSGGAVQEGGCSVSDNLPDDLKVVVSGTSCAITGMPAAATTGAIDVIVTAVNAAGMSKATVMITVNDSAPGATAPALTAPNSATLTLALGAPATGLVFGNSGGAVQEGGCSASENLPDDLMVVVSGTSCAITGMPSAATAGAIEVTVTAVNAVGKNDATVMITVVNNNPLTAPPPAKLAAAFAHTCAIVDGGILYCWGRGRSGQLGVGDTDERSTPARVGADGDWTQVSAGFGHTCAIKAGAELYCWGSLMRLGLNGNNSDYYVPVKVVKGDSKDNWTQVSTADNHTCAVTTTGELHCWGAGSNGRHGLGDTNFRTSPARVGTASNWAQVSNGARHSCAINTDGELHCWGNGADGRLGLGDTGACATPLGNTGDCATPARVGSAANWIQVSAGREHTCALNDAGQLHCWGKGGAGRLGLGDSGGRATPVRVGTSADWAQINTGEAHTCAVTTAGQLYCWGSREFGRLGLGFEVVLEATVLVGSDVPARVGGATDWTEVGLGLSHSCAANDKGQLYCWGNNGSNRLGQGGLSSGAGNWNHVVTLVNIPSSSAVAPSYRQP